MLLLLLLLLLLLQAKHMVDQSIGAVSSMGNILEDIKQCKVGQHCQQLELGFISFSLMVRSAVDGQHPKGQHTAQGESASHQNFSFF